MSRGMDRDDIERVEEQAAQSQVTLSQGRAGGAGSAADDPRHGPRLTGGRPGATQPLGHERTEVHHGRHRYEWSEVERALLTEIGRFRTLDEKDAQRVFYRGSTKRFRQDAEHLSRQGLLLRRSVVVGRNHDIRHVLVLSKKAKKLLQHRGNIQPRQALYAGFVKPAEVSHDASIYRMYEAEAAHLKALGARVSRVVLDFEFKKKIYSELNKKGDYGSLEYARSQAELARLHDLPTVDGKITLPDLRIEYEAADGTRSHIDLELATENYRPGHMSQKTRAGFKMYGVNSTSRGHRAEWEGRELTAHVLAL